MKIFRSIANWFKPPKASANMYGLTKEESNLLKELRGHPAWRVFQKTIDTAINIHAETVLFAVLTEDMLTARGRVLGLREAGTLIDRIILGDERIEREQRRLEPRDRDDPSLIYGTDYRRRA